MKALVFDNFGSPEVLYINERDNPVPGDEELLVEITASGLNFADIYRRQGRYPLAGRAPWIAGYEGAGRVVAVGDGVKGWKAGDRLGFADVPLAHASHVLVPVEHAIHLPDWLEEEDAASILLQGLTADYLVHDVLVIKPGMRVSILAAAGGVGKLLTGLLIQEGIDVFAVASSEDKRTLCLERGASAVSDYEGWADNARRWSGGGCDVVFDSVGSTLIDSLSALRDGGRVVLYGMSGGKIPAVDPATFLLSSTGVIGADLWTYLTSQTERQRRADRLFQALKDGAIQLPSVKRFPLSAGADAHRQLELRDFSGKVLLIP